MRESQPTSRSPEEEITRRQFFSATAKKILAYALGLAAGGGGVYAYTVLREPDTRPKRPQPFGPQDDYTGM